MLVLMIYSIFSLATTSLLEAQDKSTVSEDAQTAVVESHTEETNDILHKEVDDMSSNCDEEGSSSYDSCEESWDSSGDEGSVSITSTVVHQASFDNLLDGLAIDDKVIPRDGSVGEEHDKPDQIEKVDERNDIHQYKNSQEDHSNCDDSNHDEFFGVSNFNDTQDCSLTRITQRSHGCSSVQDINIQNDSIAAKFDNDDDSEKSESVEESEDMSCDSSEGSRKTRYSTIDTSVYHHPSIQELNEAHVDTSVILETKTPQSRQVQGVYSGEDIVTSPLDRFQVQVLNGGSDCKVTPIGNNMFNSAQSPILKAQSPNVSTAQKYSSISMSSFQSKSVQKTAEGTSGHLQTQRLLERDKKTSFIPTSKTTTKSKTAIKKSVDESIHSESTESFYSSNTSESETGDSILDRNANGDTTDYSASAFLPNVDNLGVEKVRSHVSDTTGDIGKDKKQTPFSKSPMDGTGSHADRTPGGTILSTLMSRTPRAAAFIEKHMADEKDRLLQVLSTGISAISPMNTSTQPQSRISKNNNLAFDFASESKSPPSLLESKSKNPRPLPNNDQQILEELGLEDDSKLITLLSPEEFDVSPPIIKKLVTREDINRGIVLINNWLVTSDDDCIPEDTALEILNSDFNASQVKRIFLSLCSLQRMMISRRTNPEGRSVMHYVVLTSKK